MVSVDGSGIRSRERVVKHGEVFTPPHIVRAMVDLVDIEARRLDARILEPACGNGNFLVEILERRLANGRDLPPEKALLGLMGLYGIDILPDNVEECRMRLWGSFVATTGVLPDEPLARAARYVLTQNIVAGDTLAGTTLAGTAITLPEWELLPDRRFGRRDYWLASLSVREKGVHPMPVRTYEPATLEELARMGTDGV